jgi:hypothetical protein
VISGLLLINNAATGEMRCCLRTCACLHTAQAFEVLQNHHDALKCWVPWPPSTGGGSGGGLFSQLSGTAHEDAPPSMSVFLSNSTMTGNSAGGSDLHACCPLQPPWACGFCTSSDFVPTMLTCEQGKGAVCTSPTVVLLAV